MVSGERAKYHLAERRGECGSEVPDTRPILAGCADLLSASENRRDVRSKVHARIEIST